MAKNPAATENTLWELLCGRDVDASRLAAAAIRARFPHNRRLMLAAHLREVWNPEEGTPDELVEEVLGGQPREAG